MGRFTELNGKVADVRDEQGKLLYSANERSLCVVRNHRQSTTVNGVCLDCARTDKTVPQNRRKQRAPHPGTTPAVAPKN